MFCMKCGRELADGVKFCPNCGFEIQKGEMPPLVKRPSNSVPTQTQILLPVRRQLHKVRIIVAVFAMLAMVVALFVLFRNKADEYPIFYIASDGARLVKSSDAGPDDIIEVMAGRESYINRDDYVVFSPDREYVYFYSRFDESNKIGTLSKAEWSKLKKNGKKNSEYVEVVDKGVEQYTVLESGNVVYCTNEPALYYYDGEQSTMLMEGDFAYKPLGNNELLFYEKVDKDEKNRYGLFVAAPHLYYVDLGNPDERILLSENVYPLCMLGDELYPLLRTKYNDYYNDLIVTTDPDNANDIVIAKLENNDTPVICSVGINKNKEVIAQNSLIISEENGTIYFVRYTDEQLQFGDEQFGSVVELCSYNKGQVQIIDDHLMAWLVYDGAIFYSKVDTLISRYQASDYDEDAYLPTYFDLSYVFITSDHTVHEIAPSVINEIGNRMGESNDLSCYANGENLYFGTADKSVWCVPIKEGTLDSIEHITDNGCLYGSYNGIVYYVNNIYSNNGYTFCDLYSLDNGQTKCLAEYILYDDIYIYEDNTMFFSKYYVSATGHDLYMITPDNAVTHIAEGVKRFSKLKNNDLIYIASDDLYAFDGKTSHMIDSGIKWYSVPDSMLPLNLNICNNMGADYNLAGIGKLDLTG